jgi:putative endonuclease
MEKTYNVYIMASRSLNFYVGVTSNLIQRTAQHKFGVIPGFTDKYKIHRLVSVESFLDVRYAIRREKQIKSWRREKKIALIKQTNPAWADLAEDWFPKANCRSLAALGMTGGVASALEPRPSNPAESEIKS